MASLLLSLLITFIAQETRPDPGALIETARGLLPAYEGDHKAFLTTAEKRDVQAADHLFSAALLLEPENAYGLWWHGHALVLLAEDARNRGQVEAAERRDGAALAAFDRAIALQPSYTWAFYARAMTQRNRGAYRRALADFDEAVRLANAALEGAGAGEQDALFVRFKARQWRADTRMRVFEFERAREEFRAFYADNGNNKWDLAYSLAETHLQERDFASARRVYAGVLEVEEYRPFGSTYSQLGYLAGLTGDSVEAVRRLTEALEREFQPTLYTRLWLWILSEGMEEEHERARVELVDFVAHPPSSLSEWDLALGRFVVGELDPQRFAVLAREEEERRKREAESLDDLGCEVHYYLGLRHRLDAEALADQGARRKRLSAALAAYLDALAYTPENFKWEWAYARLAVAELAQELLLPPRGYIPSAPSFIERLSPMRLHRAGESMASALTGIEGLELLPGDLLFGFLEGAEDHARPTLAVVAVDRP